MRRARGLARRASRRTHALTLTRSRARTRVGASPLACAQLTVHSQPAGKNGHFPSSPR